MHRAYWSIETSSCLQPSSVIHLQFSNHMNAIGISEEEWSLLYMIVSERDVLLVHLLIIISISPPDPAVSLGRLERDMAVHYAFIIWDWTPWKTIIRLELGHQSRHAVVCCIQRSWEMWHRCLPASSHGMQACRPEAWMKRQSSAFVFVSLNHKLLKTLGKHGELVQLRK